MDDPSGDLERKLRESLQVERDKLTVEQRVRLGFQCHSFKEGGYYSDEHAIALCRILRTERNALGVQDAVEDLRRKAKREAEELHRKETAPQQSTTGQQSGRVAQHPPDIHSFGYTSRQRPGEAPIAFTADPSLEGQNALAWAQIRNRHEQRQSKALPEPSSAPDHAQPEPQPRIPQRPSDLLREPNRYAPLAGAHRDELQREFKATAREVTGREPPRGSGAEGPGGPPGDRGGLDRPNKLPPRKQNLPDGPPEANKREQRDASDKRQSLDYSTKAEQQREGHRFATSDREAKPAKRYEGKYTKNGDRTLSERRAEGRHGGRGGRSR